MPLSYSNKFVVLSTITGLGIASLLCGCSACGDFWPLSHSSTTYHGKSHDSERATHKKGRVLVPGVTSYFSGNLTNIQTSTSAGLLLVGGSNDRDDAMQWFVDRSGRGDVVVLRTSGSDGYNDWLVAKGANSVESLVFSKRDAASSPAVIERVRQAEAIFFAGGDQSTYINLWKGTPLIDEVNAAAARGAVIGGTSAGLAILGQFVYSAQHESSASTDALANCYHTDITIETGFLTLPHMENVITDSHFHSRQRMGRSLVFLARMLQDRLTSIARDIAVDEEVAMAVDQDGKGRVFADSGSVYFLEARNSPTVCESGKPVTLKSVSVLRLGTGQEFDLGTWTSSEGLRYSLDVDAGIVSSSNGSIY